VRITTKLATGLMGVGVLAVSYKLGLPTATATPLANTDGTTTSLTSDPVTTPAPAASATPSASAAPSKAPTASGGTTSKPKATKKPSTSGSSNAGGNTNPAPASTSKTKTGDAINYRYGTVQVSVTEDANGKITAVDMVQAGATGGRDSAFPALQQAAISSQGSNFGNVSRATFTTQAFKNALDSALAKF
jgi:uncharacterized protein with FMN-binding domain